MTPDADRVIFLLGGFDLDLVGRVREQIICEIQAAYEDAARIADEERKKHLEVYDEHKDDHEDEADMARAAYLSAESIAEAIRAHAKSLDEAK